MPELAAAQYAAVLTADPGDMTLAARAFRQAVLAGDRVLAVRAASLLDRSGALPPDGRLLLLGEQIAAADWTAARASLDRIEREQAFGFAVPIVRAWLMQGAGGGDPLELLGRQPASAFASAYGNEHRILLLIARGRAPEAADIVKATALGGGIRDLRLRILTATALAADGDKAAALALLQGDDPALRTVRQNLEGGKRSDKPVIDAAFGYSELLIRIAADLNRERVTPLSPALARIATFAAPSNVEAWLATGQLLAMNEQLDPALAALDQVPADDPLASAARGTRIRILVRKGAKDQALALNQAVLAQPDATVADWTLQGDILGSLDRFGDAADAYDKAIALIGSADDKDDRLWSLWLMKGSALEQADRWPEAKAALEKAHALAPDQAVVLNYLGYAQLERRENIKAARALIEKASALKPDDAAITDSLGWAYFLEGDTAAAIVKLEAAAEGDPGGSEINEHLGDAYWAAGRRIEARFAWRAALVNADTESTDRLKRKLDFGPDTDERRP